MKKILFVLALFVASVVGAQPPYMAPVGLQAEGEDFSLQSPKTVLAVDVVVSCEQLVVGPYARYAQKYLGVRAPLSDKCVWDITGASVALLEGDEHLFAGEPQADCAQALSHIASTSEFIRPLPDKTDLAVMALEDAAQAAAKQIFALRRARLELVTGNQGEHVFGAGLESALREIDRLEQAYLELFLGKRLHTTRHKRFVVYPQADKKQLIICRFSPAEGLLSANDLSGEVILLQIEPSGEHMAAGLEADSNNRSVTMFRVADPATCTVHCGGKEMDRKVLPLFEFGRTIRVALPRH